MNPKQNKKRILTVTLAVGVACILVFIWGNSVLPGSVSSMISGFVMKLLGWSMTEYTVRKAGHFTEFLLLGAVLGLFFTVKGTKRKDKTLYLCLLALFVPLMDETIQLFSDDRGPQVTDIWIDIAGYACGCLPVLVVAAVIRWAWQKKRKQ